MEFDGTEHNPRQAAVARTNHIDGLFLELAQFTTAKTRRELELERVVRGVYRFLKACESHSAERFVSEAASLLWPYVDTEVKPFLTDELISQLVGRAQAGATEVANVR